MIIHKLIIRGYDHPLFCEDFAFVKKHDNLVFSGIFDGCSTGQDSHFASSLFAKIFLNNIEKINTKNPLDAMMRQLLHYSIKDILQIKGLLNLHIEDLLTTIVIMIFNTGTNEANIVFVGDGFAMIDGEKIIIDQNNQPDYLAYHIENLQRKDNFVEWYERLKTKFIFEVINDISICSDGIQSFTKNSESPDEAINPVEYLLDDTFLIKNKTMLSRKCNILRTKFNIVPLDDLSIVRIKLNL